MQRFLLAFRVFWKTWTDREFAHAVDALSRHATPGPDLRVLAVLQRDGRLVDFLLEDIDSYSDEQVGAAARDIHRGCRKALKDYLAFEPVLAGQEETPIRIAADFDPATIRLTGNVTGTPPFQGVIKHHGWRVRATQLPALPSSQDGAAVVAPAEVEVS